MYKKGKLYAQIDDYLNFAKLTMTSIIYCHNKQPKNTLQTIKQADRLLKLDNQAKKLFIHHIEQNSCNNLKTIGTLSKLS